MKVEQNALLGPLNDQELKVYGSRSINQVKQMDKDELIGLIRGSLEGNAPSLNWPDTQKVDLPTAPEYPTKPMLPSYKDEKTSLSWLASLDSILAQTKIKSDGLIKQISTQVYDELVKKDEEEDELLKGLMEPPTKVPEYSEEVNSRQT